MNLEPYRRSFLPATGAGEPIPTADDAGAINLSVSDLPAVCPHASMPRWAWHPRVFLDVVNRDEAKCPYCCTRYRLRSDARVHDHGFGALCLHQHRGQGTGMSATRGAGPQLH